MRPPTSTFSWLPLQQEPDLTITGPELIRLLEHHGWEVVRRSRHGVFLSRQATGDDRPRMTVIPTRNRPLSPNVLAQILGPKQTGIGRSGLEAMLGG